MTDIEEKYKDNEILIKMLHMAQTKYLGMLINLACINSNVKKVLPTVHQVKLKDCITIEELEKKLCIIFWYNTQDKSTHQIRITWEDLVNAGNAIKREHEAGK